MGLLMERRADVGVKNRDCDMLHAIAVKRGDWKVVRLLENGADARVMNGGEMLVELMVGRM